MKEIKNLNISTQTRQSTAALLLICAGLALALALAYPQLTYAEEEGLCRLKAASVITSDFFSADEKTHLQSNKLELTNNTTSRFSGDVLIQQADKRIEADSAVYEKPKEEVFVEGNVKLTTPDIQIKSDSAFFNLKTHYSLLQQTEFQSLNSPGRGQAKSIEVKNETITELNQASYTTCDAENVDWILNASTITLNHESRQGSASNAVLRFKDIPFFYFPYIRFPLGSSRLSGFLFPYIGFSEKNGTEEKIPYYWNIHPQLDATITPWNMTKRGLLLHSEFRYLSEKNEGILTSESLNNDKIFKADRQLWQWKNTPLPDLGWQTAAEYNYIADDQHFIDFSDNLTKSSASSLVRSGDVSYNTDNWVASLKAEDYLVLSGEEPYKRLPQVNLNSRYATIDNSINYAVQSEAVRFEHKNNKVIGERVYFAPSMSYPLASTAGYLTPKLSLNHTEYNLQQTPSETKLSRTVPTFSLNSGLFFERDSEVLDTAYLHTLEPQLFYVYTPYVDQSNFPIFDTSVRGFDINNFTSDYRFNGIDRIGDDNRLTAALATRFFDQENGLEVFMARIGQIYYFNDRKVQLDNNIDTTPSSSIITEVQFKPGKWQFISQITWDSVLDDKLNSSHLIGYQNNFFGLSVAHRYTLNSIENKEIKANWTINSNWQVTASTLYDIRNKHVVEDLLGVNYESCCWALRLSAKDRYINKDQQDQGVFIELVLKGLGGFGVQGSSILNTIDQVKDL